MRGNNLKNTIANYGGKAWGFLSVFLFIPIYVKLLGVEAYAIIGLYTLVLGIVSFADAGMSSAITREFSKGEDARYKYSVLLSIEKLFASICFVIGMLLFFLADIIAQKWLGKNSLPFGDIVYYIRLIGIGVPIQLFASIYFGGLMGLQSQIAANTIQVIWSLLRTLGAVALLLVYKPSLEVFFICQIVCNGLYCFFLRYVLFRRLKKSGQLLRKTFSRLPQDVWKYIGGMTLVTIISSVNIQADKVITSTLFSLQQFGYYSLASTLSQIPVLLASPLVVTIFPAITRLVSYQKGKLVLMAMFEKMSFVVNLIIFPIGLTLFLYAQPIVLLWAGGSAGVNEAGVTLIIQVVRCLSIGGFFLALQLMPFYFLLAKGKTIYTIYQTGVQAFILIPSLYFFIKKFGVAGAGIPWCVINFLGLVYLYLVVFIKELNSPIFPFLRKTLLQPLSIHLLVYLIVYVFVSPQAPIGAVVIAIICGAVSVVASIFLYNFQAGRLFYNIKAFIPK